jgi:hypothetical protein
MILILYVNVAKKKMIEMEKNSDSFRRMKQNIEDEMAKQNKKLGSEKQPPRNNNN